MTDDVYLGMQAQNIATVDMSVIRHIESTALDEFFSDVDRVSLPTLSILSALSQMWVFGLYEFLRTWRQRARTLIGFADKLATFATAKEREVYMNEIMYGIKQKARYVRFAPVFYLEHVSKIGDEDFMTTIRDYKARTEDLFREVEAIRMPLAKHEMVGKERLFAEAPGFGGINKLTGSMYWQIVLSESTVTIVERRELADKFMGILSWHEEEEAALHLAQTHKKRTNRSRRRERKNEKEAVSAAQSAPKTSDVLTGSRFGLYLYGSKGVIFLPITEYPDGEPSLWKSASWRPDRRDGEWRRVEASPNERLDARLKANVRMAADLIDAMEKDRQPACSAVDGRWTVEMLQGVYLSQIRGGRVAFPMLERRHPLDNV